MKHILVVGEKTSQVKKFVTTLCGTYQSTKQAKYTYTYEGVWNPGGKQVRFTFLPLAGHITTIDTARGYAWGQCPPIKIVADPNAIVVKNTRKYVTILRKQIKGKDELWLALDPDSEGDNIALEVVNILSRQLRNVPVKRIWNSSLTTKEIYRAFLNPKPWQELLALGVQGRRIIDAWLGFAGTREITRAARQVAKIKVLSVGRVQLPTLLLVVEADMAHEMFIVEDRWKLEATFVAPQGDYIGVHQLGLVDDKSQVEAVMKRLGAATTGTIDQVDQKQQRTPPPVPHNTTSAISLLTKVMKIKASRALELMVELYNRGLLSYPRTENKKFKEEFPHKDILSKLLQKSEFIPYITLIQDTSQVRCNGPKKGVEEDHDPIHPTGELAELSSVDAQHRKAWDILTRYYISLFMPDLVISQLSVTTMVDTDLFETEGRGVIDQGWKEAQWWSGTKTKDLPPLQPKTIVKLNQLDTVHSQTKPPRRLRDSQLLLEMEKANIGTKSSRPDIIKKLEARNYVQRQGQNLVSTPWGRALIASLAPIWPKIITPEFTSHVEELMDEVATGKRSYTEMIEQLRQEYLRLHKDLLPKLGQYRSLLTDLNLSDQTKKVSTADTEKINQLLERSLSV